MYLEDIHILKPSSAGPYTTIQAAIQAALISNPVSAVIIAPEYAGTDTYTNASGVTVLDLRQGTANTGSQFGSGANANTTFGTVSATSVIVSSVTVGGVAQAIGGIKAIGPAAAPITAAAGGAFVSALSAPGNSILEGVVFKVKATGWVTFPAGTYTATVQPLIHASTSLGFTASAASAIVSAAALTMTITSATATKNVIWETEAEIAGDTTTGNIAGKSGGWIKDVNALGLLVTPAILVQANTPVAVAFTSATAPVQFLTQIVLGSGAPSTSVVTLNKFYLES